MPEPDTNTSLIDPKTLIDHKMIAAADAARDATNKAAHEARLALDAATKALRAATAAADEAAMTGTDMMTAETAVMTAELALRAAERRVARTGAAAADADRTHRASVGQAHRALAWTAIDRRHAACRAGEAARAALAAAETEYLAATADLNRCVNAGLGIPGWAHAGQVALRPEADEARFWNANQVDVACRRFYPNERVGETV